MQNKNKKKDVCYCTKYLNKNLDHNVFQNLNLKHVLYKEYNGNRKKNSNMKF